MSKKVHLGEDGRKGIVEGVNILANAVKVTLGAKGRTAVIQREGFSPLVTKDGVTVARNITLKDPLQQIGSELIKEASILANDRVGDGTTTTTVLTQALVNNAVEGLRKGFAYNEIREGFDIVCNKVKANIADMTVQCVTREDYERVANVSANGDKSVGKLVADAIEKAGKNGVITVETGTGLEDELEHTSGMSFDRGFISPYFVNNPEKQTVEYDNAYILLVDKKLDTIQEIVPVLEAVANTGKPLVIIADDVVGQVLSTLVVNNLQGNVKVVAVKAPAFGDRRKEVMNDIATLTGGVYINEEVGLSLDTITLNELGGAERVIVNKDETIIVGGFGQNTEAFNNRVESISSAIERAASEYDKEVLKERLAKMVGGVCVIKVGAVSEVELNERKDRVDDALFATQAAIKDGIVIGGGAALLHASKIDYDEDLSQGVMFGVTSMIKSLREPMCQIIRNAGNSEDSIGEIIRTVQDRVNTHGYNVITGVIDNMHEMDIVDPVKVTLTAMDSAVSIASMILTTEAAITIEPEEKKDAPMGGMPQMRY